MTNPLYGHQIPIQLAIPTQITDTQIQEWVNEIVRIAREFSTNVEGRSVFSGPGGTRITARGAVSSQSKASTSSKPAAEARILTLSSEAKSMLVTMISMFWTEIFYSITYLHHRAFELDDLMIFSNTLSDRLAEYMRQESARQVSVADIRKSGITPNDAATHALAVEGKKLSGLIEKWVKAFKLYSIRQPAATTRVQHHIERMESMIGVNSIGAFYQRLEEIRRFFPSIQRNFGRTEKLVIDCAEDVIIPIHEDFSYPCDGEFFEIAALRSNARHGYDLLKTIGDELRKMGLPDPTAQIYSKIKEHISIDIRANLAPAFAVEYQIGQYKDKRMESQVTLTKAFIDSVTKIVADYIIDIALSCYRYTIAATDRVSSTTIQLRVIKVVYMLMESRHILPLSANQTQFLTDVMTAKVR